MIIKVFLHHLIRRDVMCKFLPFTQWGVYRSGQTGQTVTLLDYSSVGSNPTAPIPFPSSETQRCQLLLHERPGLDRSGARFGSMGRLNGSILHRRANKSGFHEFFNGTHEHERVLLVARDMYRRGKRCGWADIVFRPSAIAN